MRPDFQAFLGNFWARCVSNVRDASSVRQGRSLISRHFYAVSGTWCAGHVHGAARTRSDFQAFLGYVRDASWSSQGSGLIFRHSYVVFGTRCAGHVQDVEEMQLDFKHF
ncbi:Hypothetical predicted protein [Olea europaea subsp. europaea]|uniref:Uncharacterized protein n=1 Tax=Olea europaea subsp. europaea TaxID=158383 RepID=A0A8S0PQC1_OLEEU|nr:Hypothetical predicted protein [Olea europaea subsp. europaea]